MIVFSLRGVLLVSQKPFHAPMPVSRKNYTNIYARAFTAPPGSPPFTQRVTCQRRLEQQQASLKVKAAGHTAASAWCVLFLADVSFELLNLCL